MSTQISSRRGVQLALQISSLPPLALGSPMNEKDQLPCIMITPSTPIHEHDYQLYQFQPEPPSGFFSCLRRAFSSTPAPIALPQSPVIGYEYSATAFTTKSSKTCWSPSKRFRALLVVFAVLFFALHVLFMPKWDAGIYEVFHGHPGAPMMDDTVAVWEGMAATATATPTAVVAEEVHSGLSL